MAEEIDRELENIISNINRELKKIEGGTLKGLIRFSIVIRRDMDNTSPSIPVDLGNLRASYFSVTSRGSTQAGSAPAFKMEGDAETVGRLAGDHASVLTVAKKEIADPRNPSVRMGFSAFYGVFVHENVDATFRQPETGATKAATGAKFFEASLKRNSRKGLAIIAKEARVK